MTRIRRIVGVGYPHHITQRGNYRRDVLLDDEDRQIYTGYLNDYSKKYNLSIIAYCLMTNHIHIIAVPQKEDSLARTFNVTHMRYTQHYNKKYESGSGHLWQGRFYSCVLDQRHLIEAVRYVERNPERAGLVEKPWDWKWSSCAEHVGIRSDEQIQVENLCYYIDGKIDWKEYVTQREDKIFTETLKKQTLNGYPLGSVKFVSDLEKNKGISISYASVGRPFRGRRDVPNFH